MRRDFPDFLHFLKLFESAFSPRLHFWYSLGLPYFLKIKFDLLLLFAVGKGGRFSRTTAQKRGSV